MRIIVTDLTRFSKEKDILCLAGVTEDGKKCIRPLQTAYPYYLTYGTCKELNILPGTILEGTFTPVAKISSPHTEDCNFKNLKKVGTATSEIFKSILEKSSTNSIREGFGSKKPITNKVFDDAPQCSIITLNIKPSDFRVVTTTNNGEEKIRAHITDGDGVSLSFLSITDLGFFDNVGQTKTRRISAEEVTTFIHQQDELYIRLGLGRWYKSPQGVAGYWMQVNGIYTFPDYDRVVRSY